MKVWKIIYVFFAKRQKISSKTDDSKKATYSIRLYNHIEGLDATIDCRSDTFILDEAEDQGIDLPYSDRAGAGSACAPILGEWQIDQSDQSFLNDDQIELGFILLCVSYPKSDCNITTHMEEALY